MFKCREACKLLSEAQDRKLTLRERVLLNFHLAVLRENLIKWLSDKYSLILFIRFQTASASKRPSETNIRKRK